MGCLPIEVPGWQDPRIILDEGSHAAFNPANIGEPIIIVVGFVIDADIAAQQSVADLLAPTKHQGAAVEENVVYIPSVYVIFTYCRFVTQHRPGFPNIPMLA